jgi:uncharacterized membrane protein HdeD (DUF308 family)
VVTGTWLSHEGWLLGLPAPGAGPTMILMLELLVRRWWMIALRGLLAVVFGLLTIAWPGITVLALVLLWGVYTLVDGVTAVIMGVTNRSAPTDHRVIHGLLGLLGIAAGLITFLWPQITAVALLVIIAAWALVAGALQIAAAIRLRKQISNEWFLGLSGAVCVVLGVLLIVQPAEGAIGLVIAIATFAIVWGVSLILFGLRLRRLGRTNAHERATMGV